MEDLFNMIGKLYVDVYNTQKIIEMLQKQLKEKDQELAELKMPKVKDE
jgi:hypothetical protein